MKKIILFSIIAVSAVTFSSVAKTAEPPTKLTQASGCEGCAGGDRVCCANPALNWG